PKLSVTPDGRLMMVAGGSDYGGTRTLRGFQPRVSFSKDAREWTAPKRVLSEGEWLWRVTWHDGKAYGASYTAPERSSKEEWNLTLYASGHGAKYEPITRLQVSGRPNETTLRFMPDGEMVALVRREGGNQTGWVGTSKPPYREWSWRETKQRLGGPNFIRTPDGNWWACSRLYP